MKLSYKKHYALHIWRVVWLAPDGVWDEWSGMDHHDLKTVDEEIHTLLRDHIICTRHFKCITTIPT